MEVCISVTGVDSIRNNVMLDYGCMISQLVVSLHLHVVHTYVHVYLVVF